MLYCNNVKKSIRLSLFIVSICNSSFGMNTYVFNEKHGQDGDLSPDQLSIEVVPQENACFDSERARLLRQQIGSQCRELMAMEVGEYLRAMPESDQDQAKTQMRTAVKECAEFYMHVSGLRYRHFGYPANLVMRNPLVDFFRSIEAHAFLANNCGDPYEQGSYVSDSKKVERSILEIIAKKLGISGQKVKVVKEGRDEIVERFGGYITSGGSESNDWAINQAYAQQPDGILYFCESAHYSIPKSAERYRGKNGYRIIPQVSTTDESINCDMLFAKVL